MERGVPPSSASLRGAARFVSAALGAMTWRALLTLQAVGLAYGLMAWLERWNQPGQPRLPLTLTGQALTALLVLLAALASDEAVRRGSSVWRAFILSLLCASGTNVLAQWLLHGAFGASLAGPPAADILNDFFNVGGVWGTVLMVYLNRKSAQRLTARLRAGELERVRTERRLIASRLAAAEAEIDPATLLLQLAEARDLYAAGRPDADDRLEALITRLRRNAADAPTAQPHEAHP